MRVLVRFALPTLAVIALVACGGEAPAPAPAPTDPASGGAPATTAVPAPATLDTASLRERATAALAANRLYAPAGDNAVEDYLALRDREPAEASVATALADLAPYVVIGAEQATASEDFAEAGRLVDLLARMDADAPAVPRLREALATARSASEARQAAERAEAERRAEEAARTAAAAPPAAATVATLPPAPHPAATPSADRPTRPTATAPVASPTAPTPPPPVSTASNTPAATATAPTPAARDLVHRVQPRFPEAATRRRLQGEVELQVRIRADGTVEDVEVLRATPPGVFDREAVLAVRRWRYAPATGPGQARVVLQFKRPDAN